MIYWFFSAVTAVLAYFAGCLKSTVLASNFIFHKNLRRLGSGNVFISNFRRVYGWKGAVKLLLTELALDLLPILIGLGLFSIKGHGIVGAALAGFCLIIGRLWPMTYGFRGSHAIFPLILMGFGLDLSVGLALVIAAIAVVWLSRYYSLGALVCALVLAVTALLMLDDTLATRLSLFAAAAVCLYHVPAIRRMLDKTEPKLSFEQDISYKFDEKF
ncbi:MAG: glycerol-3-phosphate acyltransferase [Oscillospiraceae bacterium]|nr:glycerol-3-phosphate acyltransferase [Oscillospiraceae bacterium]